MAKYLEDRLGWRLEKDLDKQGVADQLPRDKACEAVNYLPNMRDGYRVVAEKLPLERKESRTFRTNGARPMGGLTNQLVVRWSPENLGLPLYQVVVRPKDRSGVLKLSEEAYREEDGEIVDGCELTE